MGLHATGRPPAAAVAAQYFRRLVLDAPFRHGKPHVGFNCRNTFGTSRRIDCLARIFPSACYSFARLLPAPAQGERKQAPTQPTMCTCAAETAAVNVRSRFFLPNSVGFFFPLYVLRGLSAAREGRRVGEATRRETHPPRVQARGRCHRQALCGGRPAPRQQRGGGGAPFQDAEGVRPGVCGRPVQLRARPLAAGDGNAAL